MNNKWLYTGVLLAVLLIEPCLALPSGAGFVKAGNDTAVSKIDTTTYVDIGGIKQFVRIKGSNDQHPVLLVLHGGPGCSLMDFSGQLTNRLEEKSGCGCIISGEAGLFPDPTADTFSNARDTFTFGRNKRKQITGFEVTGRRIKKLRFVKR